MQASYRASSSSSQAHLGPTDQQLNDDSIEDVRSACMAVIEATTTQDRHRLLQALKSLREKSRKLGNAIVPIFQETGVLIHLTELFLSPPDEGIERLSLNTIMCILNACKDTRAIFANNSLLHKVITVVRGEEPEIHWLATSLTVCAAIFEYATDDIKAFIQEGLPVQFLSNLAEYIFRYDLPDLNQDPDMDLLKLNAKRRGIDSLKINTMTSLVWLLRCYCEKHVDPAAIPFLLRIYVATSNMQPLELQLTPEQSQNDNRDIHINRMYRHLSGMMVNLLESRSLPPQDYHEIVRPFMTDKLVNHGTEDDRNFSTVQELLCELLEHAIISGYESIDTRIQNPSGLEMAMNLIEDCGTYPLVRHGAFRVILASLRCDPCRVIVELMGDSSDNVPIRRIANARKCDFESLKSCAQCFLEIIKAGDVPADRLANDCCLASAIDFLVLEDEDLVICGLEIIVRVCELCLQRNSVSSLDSFDRRRGETTDCHGERFLIYDDLYERMYREDLQELLGEFQTQTTNPEILSRIETIQQNLPGLEKIYNDNFRE